MEEQKDNDKLIGKLIKKRKDENAAFMKILNAIENKGTTPVEQPNIKNKSKS